MVGHQYEGKLQISLLSVQAPATPSHSHQNQKALHYKLYHGLLKLYGPMDIISILLELMKIAPWPNPQSSAH